MQQKERASISELRRALVDTLRHTDTLPEEQAAQKREAIFYLLSLIMHRRPLEEHNELIELVQPTYTELGGKFNETHNST